VRKGGGRGLRHRKKSGKDFFKNTFGRLAYTTMKSMKESNVCKGFTVFLVF